MCQPTLPSGLQPCLRERLASEGALTDGGVQGRAGEAHLIVVSALGSHPKQLSQRSSGAATSAWGPGTALPGPKSMVPGSSAWSLSLGQELRTVPHPNALPLPWRLLTTLVPEAHSSAETANTRPRGGQGLEWSPVPYLSCQSHEAKSPREPGMSGSGRRTEDCQLFNPEPGMSQLAPSSSLVPRLRLCSTQAPLFPGPATCTGNEAS